MAFCTQCGASMPDDAEFCTACGASLKAAQAAEAVEDVAQAAAEAVNTAEAAVDTAVDTAAQTANAVAEAAPVYAAPAAPVYVAPTYAAPPEAPAEPEAPAKKSKKDERPEKPGTVGTGNFFLSTILLAIPVIGLLFAIIWACGGAKTDSKRNFARSYLCFLLIGVIICAIAAIIVAIMYWDQISAFFALIKQYGLSGAIEQMVFGLLGF